MLTTEQLQQFEKDGYVVIKGFLSAEEVASLETAQARLVSEMDPSQHQISIFSTDEDRQVELRAKDDYFLQSGDKVRFFWEDGAFDAAKQLTVDRRLALNKIGHALHWLVPEFRAVTFSERVRACCRALGFRRPVVAQSMYIFKQAHIGGAVTPHQDATFLYTRPERIVGLWLALEPADLHNGCLWFAPGSHRAGPLTRRFVRNSQPAGPQLVFRGQTAPLDDAAYVPVEVAAGDCVLISGLVHHRSDANTSPRSRHIYTFHVLESRGCQYADDNWLQPTEALPFPSLYE